MRAVRLALISEEVECILRPLGLQRTRAVRIICFSREVTYYDLLRPITVRITCFTQEARYESDGR